VANTCGGVFSYFGEFYTSGEPTGRAVVRDGAAYSLTRRGLAALNVGDKTPLSLPRSDWGVSLGGGIMTVYGGLLRALDDGAAYAFSPLR